MGISNSAMLTELNISVWTGVKQDKSASNKVTNDANARSDAGRFSKNLLAGTTLRKDIADYAAATRTWHNIATLPWSDKGGRLLPTSKFMAYKTELNARRIEFDRLVQRFLADYGNVVAAAHQHLGALFDPADYPDAAEVARKFDFKLAFLPIPEVGDFRLQVADDELAELNAQYEEAYKSRLNEAMGSAWQKLFDMLEGMSAKLVEPEDGEKKIFHATFLTNALELCELLAHFNIDEDEKRRKMLNGARKEFERVLAGIDIEAVRKEADVREDMKTGIDSLKSKVATVLERFDEW